MERFNGLDKLIRRWQAVGIVSAQKALELVNQEPYPKIDFFDLDQSFIDEVKEPKNGTLMSIKAFLSDISSSDS